MFHSTALARTGAALGAGIAGVALWALPATAEPSPVNAPDRGTAGETGSRPELPYEKRLLLHGDLPVVPDPGRAASNPAPDPVEEPTTVFIDDGSFELIQIALGAVGGAAVAIAMSAGLTRRRHFTPA
jgi:hypothetical protein